MQYKIMTLIIYLFWVNVFIGQTKDTFNDRRVYTPIKIDDTNAPIVDGLISESIWDSVVWGEGFIEFEPDIPSTWIFLIFSRLSFILDSNSLALSKIFVKSVILIFFLIIFNINQFSVWEFF